MRCCELVGLVLAAISTVTHCQLEDDFPTPTPTPTPRSDLVGTHAPPPPRSTTAAEPDQKGLSDLEDQEQLFLGVVIVLAVVVRICSVCR